LSQYSKLPPISGANDDLQASCQSIQDVELAFDTAREEAKTMLKQLAEHVLLYFVIKSVSFCHLAACIDPGMEVLGY
jgi:hypothetical protein